MMSSDPRVRLQALAVQRGDSLAALSRMLGRNINYLQQWITHGSPRLLSEVDRGKLAAYFGVEEVLLGGTPGKTDWRAPRLDVAASAGPGALVEDERAIGSALVPASLAKGLGIKPGHASIIRVAGDSMAPGLVDGDELLVDQAKRTPNARGGIYVLRLDGTLLVKRVRRTKDGLDVSSDNPDAPPVGPGVPEVIGQVVWQMRRVR